jgi:hypothetical protein
MNVVDNTITAATYSSVTMVCHLAYISLFAAA